MEKNKFIILLILPLLIVLPGCLKTPAYLPKNLKPLNEKTSQVTKTQEQVTIYQAQINKDQAQELFGSYAKNLEHHKIVPIQLTISNDGTTTWVLTDNNIQLSKIDLRIMSNKLLNAKGWRPPLIFFGGIVLAAAVCVGIPLMSIIAANIMATSFLAASWSVSLGLALGSATFITTSCIACYDAFDKMHVRRSVYNDLLTKRGADCISIKPGRHTNILFFAYQESLPSCYKIVLTEDQEKNQLIFNMKTNAEQIA